MRRAVCRLIGHRWHRGPVERIHHHAGGPDLPPRYLLSIVCRRCGRAKTAATPEIVGRVASVTDDDLGLCVRVERYDPSPGRPGHRDPAWWQG